MSDEKVFYDQGDVKVTDSRFIVPAQTYAMAAVAAVKFSVDRPKRLLPVLLIIAGAAAALEASTNIYGFIAAMLPGFIWLACQKTLYAVRLDLSSGGTRALVSKDGAFIKSVVDALNQAIVARTS